ncbi:unnamed protein product [Chrysodeixis includens]|uniref:Uncharacterized protein n=1 Tax=Chrysodeixis includens TaxID=689277 RepID=A0A9N8PZW5_CHRIL|nr:unnamed protein product [Chrysodeixis includens]
MLVLSLGISVDVIWMFANTPTIQGLNSLLFKKSSYDSPCTNGFNLAKCRVSKLALSKNIPCLKLIIYLTVTRYTDPVYVIFFIPSFVDRIDISTQNMILLFVNL